MIAAILDWTNQADNTSDLLRMQQEILAKMFNGRS